MAKTKVGSGTVRGGVRGSVLPTACAASVGGVHAPKPRTAQIHLTRSTVGVVRVALRRCVHRSRWWQACEVIIARSSTAHHLAHCVTRAGVETCLFIHLLIVSRLNYSS